MAFVKLRRWAVAFAVVVSTAAIGVVAPASTAYADTGGCPDRAHAVHTSDTAPYRAWACWIDDGDKIRVCDNAPNDGVHAHADMWFDAGGFWLKFIAEDDGADAGCDDETGVDLQGFNRVRLRVCAQRTDQSNFACNETIWFENE
jgi:hypothetical protein